MPQGAFSNHFVRTDTDDGVAGTMILQRRKGNTIDLADRTGQLEITTKSEAKDLIRLIQEGMGRL